MTSNQVLQADYTKFQRVKQMVLPLDTEYLIAKDESVRLLDQVMEELDYTALYLTYSEKGRNPAVDPVTLTKIVVYAYTQNTYSTRQIEKACRYDLRYHYLLQGKQAPDHNTVSRFIKDHLSLCLEDLFGQFIRKLIEAREVTFDQIFLDGTKIEANANRYSFVWRGSVEKNREKLREKAYRYMTEELQMQEIPEAPGPGELKAAMRKIRNEVRKQHIVFVYGSGKRKTELQRQYETVAAMLERAEAYEKALQIMGKGRNSYSKTDPDATFMHMKDDYMRNSQLKPGYNVQIASGSEYILSVLINRDRSDAGSMIPVLEKLRRTFPEQTIGKLVADAGYESEENYDYLRRSRVEAYIKPSNHEYSKTRKFQRAMEFRLAMTYDAQEDTYTCKNGRKLRFSGLRKRVSPNGYVSTSRSYKCEDCSDCPYYGKCYKGKHTRQIQVAEKFDAYRAQSEANITSPEGILLRINRSIQAEGVFGITKQDMQYDRFLRRGMTGVKTEYLLLAFGFNINKLHHRIQEDRLGQHLLLPEKIPKTA